jgi:hypothetical protein
VKANAANSNGPIDLHEFESLAAESIEHLTVPGYFARFERRWHIDEMCRFGDKVGRAAEAMQLSYLTTIHPQLGMIRVFPLPLLQRVYEIMAPQFQWPAATPVLEDTKVHRDELRKTEGAKKHLEAAAEHAPLEVREALATVVSWLETETQKLRAVEVTNPEPPPPLRAV